MAPAPADLRSVVPSCNSTPWWKTGICDPIPPNALKLHHPGKTGLIPSTGIHIVVRLFHHTIYHGVAMDVTKFLLNDIRSARLNGVQVVLP